MLKRSHIIWFVLLALSVALVMSAIYAFMHGYRSSTRYTCVRCRLTKNSGTFFGYDDTYTEATEFSEWYSKHRPAHEHQWAWSGTSKVYYPLGNSRGCGRRHPIWEIQPEMQQRFVESATDEEVQAFYTALESPDRAAQQQGIEMVWKKILGEK